ncbi:cupredoxin domain-containing protein [Haloechinothrix sp. LS1_15]|uniref:cupredoxin domain-containing protein n=1 Tax=Haloechinothrix sp. LS1_15 TaxID=2652248 RepID=UPI00294460F7|nr:cupredoxin domain-containing protein [Haloechinothrix sp. LS1_15]MDV6013754.1 hypothetical protein [Haloechinothrix sp. LS1_15]
MSARSTVTALAATAALALAACADDPEPTDDNGIAGPDADAPEAVEVDLNLREMEFVPDEIEVPAGQPVVFHLSNEGDVPHDLTFEGETSGTLDPGETATFEVEPFTDDTVGWCDVPGHRGQGMELDVFVIG